MATTRKQPAVAANGMVTSNHPLASSAGAEMLAAGGNAVDAAVATMLALSVVEPMMTTLFGGGFMVIRLPDGSATTIDHYSVVPKRATPDMFEPVPDSNEHGVRGDLNVTGHLAVAVGGNLLGWCTALERYGRLPLPIVVAPAARFARQGFRVSPYLHGIIEVSKPALERFDDTAKVFLPGGRVPDVGERISRPEYADTLAAVGEAGAAYLYEGPLGEAIVREMAAGGGLIERDDLRGYRVYEREPVTGTYRGHEIVSMAPPSSGGAHIVQILNILEGIDVHALGFGTADAVHAIAECMKIAFADRSQYMADPESTQIPLSWLTSKDYAATRRGQLDMSKAQSYAAAAPDGEPDSTTHCCAWDADGCVVSATSTLHLAFGSRVTVGGTGMLLNNQMQLMDPVPSRTNSIAPGKRILSSMSPTIISRGGTPLFTLGTPGGLRIFGTVMQAILDVVDHGMSLQEAVEAPRVFDRGLGLEIERGFEDLPALCTELERRGHTVRTTLKVAGGMNGIFRDPLTGGLSGSACWRADGAAMGLSGGDGVAATPTARLWD